MRLTIKNTNKIRRATRALKRSPEIQIEILFWTTFVMCRIYWQSFEKMCVCVCDFKLVYSFLTCSWRRDFAKLIYTQHKI